MNQEYICVKCHTKKPLSEFVAHKYQTSGYYYCKTCKASYMKIYNQKNREKSCESAKLYRAKNRTHCRLINKVYRNNHRNEIAAYRHKRYHNDPVYKLLSNHRSLIYYNITRSFNNSSESSIELLGCTPLELKQHIENQFTNGMTWKNHGRGINKWQVDHIIPRSFFNLSDYTERKFCFHYTNLQPLWWNENLQKSNKLLSL